MTALEYGKKVNEMLRTAKGIDGGAYLESTVADIIGQVQAEMKERCAGEADRWKDMNRQIAERYTTEVPIVAAAFHGQANVAGNIAKAIRALASEE